MKRSAFTMIELIFVIVILGILAAVAVPRLADVQDDAKVAAEQGIIGGIRTGVETVRGSCLIKNYQNTASNDDTNFSAKCYPSFLETVTVATAAGTGITSGLKAEFGAVLKDPVDGFQYTAAFSAPTSTFTGPATSTNSGITEGDLNNTVHWDYNGTSGTVTIQDNP